VGGAIGVGCAAYTVAKDLKKIAGLRSSIEDAKKLYRLINNAMKVLRQVSKSCALLTVGMSQSAKNFLKLAKPQILAEDTRKITGLVVPMFNKVCEFYVDPARCTQTKFHILQMEVISESQKLRASSACDGEVAPLRDYTIALSGAFNIDDIMTKRDAMFAAAKACQQAAPVATPDVILTHVGELSAECRLGQADYCLFQRAQGKPAATILGTPPPTMTQLWTRCHFTVQSHCTR